MVSSNIIILVEQPEKWGKMHHDGSTVCNVPEFNAAAKEIYTIEQNKIIIIIMQVDFIKCV